jgi:hypothetical protein
LVLVPVVLRSHDGTGRWIPGSSASFNVWVGLSDVSRQNHVKPVVGRAYREYVSSGSMPGERDRAFWTKTRNLIREEGLGAIAVEQLTRQYFRLFHWESFFIDRLPGGKLSDSGQGFPDTPIALARGLRWSSFGLYLLVLIGAALGVALAPYRGRPWVQVVLLFLVYHLVLFFVLHVKTRYRLPMLPFLMFFGGLAWDRVREGRELSAWRWVGGVGLALILVILATVGPYLDRLGAR